jgi:hypothetical protein
MLNQSDQPTQFGHLSHLDPTPLSAISLLIQRDHYDMINS